MIDVTHDKNGTPMLYIDGEGKLCHWFGRPFVFDDKGFNVEGVGRLAQRIADARALDGSRVTRFRVCDTGDVLRRFVKDGAEWWDVEGCLNDYPPPRKDRVRRAVKER